MTGSIVTQDLRKVFTSRSRPFGPRIEKVAVDGLTIRIPRGQVTGLLGLNGAGKTTTIKMLATLLRPDSGTASVDELDLHRDVREIRRRINLIAGGERMVYARMTGRENLYYFGQLYGVSNPVLKPRIEELLDLVGLSEAGDTMVERYSRGMTQRLAIARGLINKPGYLLLDEPTLGLDPPIARDLRRVVTELAAGGTGILLTSHYLTEVEELCSYVYVIANGRHLAEGSPTQITADTGCHNVVEVVIPSPGEAVRSAVRQFAERLHITADETVDESGNLKVRMSHPDEIAGPLVTVVVNAGGAVSGLTVAEPSLEDAIMVLSGAAPSRALSVTTS